MEYKVTLIAEQKQVYNHENPNQVYIGLYQLYDGRTVWASIMDEKNGTFEWYCNCNMDYIGTLVESQNTICKSINECMDNMLDFLNGLGKLPNLIGLNANDQNYVCSRLWKKFNVNKEYKLKSLILL